jgi:transcriptional regulator with XRE-family HTH domain
LKREWLIAFRKAKGLSQEEVSKALNVSQITYCSYELGTRTPKPKMAKAISRIFNFEWTKFYEDNSTKEETSKEIEET